MKVIIKRGPAALARAVAEGVRDWINENPGKLICLAAGDTPLDAYRELIEMQRRGEVDLASVYYVGLDEWVGLGRDVRGSCAQVMFDGFYEPAGIPRARIEVFDGLCRDIDMELRRIESWIARRGGIAFTLLGVGLNGHVGFNEPGTGLPKGCVKVALDDTTRTVSAKYFDAPTAVEWGIGIGAGELKRAELLFLMAEGAHKATIVRRTIVGAPGVQVPASLMTDHPTSRIYLDEAAAGEL